MFSKVLPKLQLAWDATSLYALMFCARYYQYSILGGWRGSNIDLEFGLLVHGALEVYYKARAKGVPRGEAQVLAVKWAMQNSGKYEDGVWVPWGGIYLDQWRCTHSPKKGTKKCPYALIRVWHDAPAPSICGNCGSAIEEVRRWLPYDPKKDRFTLVRLVSWFIEEEPDEGGVEVYVFPDGTAAVELSFRFPLGMRAGTDEEFELCGHLDGLCVFGADYFMREVKSTKATLSKRYFAGFSPHVQMDTYDLAGTVLFPDLNIRGVMLEAHQTMVTGAAFQRKTLHRTEPQREEWLAEIKVWLKLAEQYAKEDHWPMNRSVCWLCHFKGICSLEPGKRETFLKANFEQNPWNPLEVR